MDDRNTQNSLASGADAQVRWYGKTNWFSLPRSIRYDDCLSHADVRVLVAIASFDMKNGSIFPPRWQLAIYTGITESNVSKRTKRLAKLGWVTIIARKGKVNQYLLHIPEYVTNRERTIKEDVRKEIAIRADVRREAQEEWDKTRLPVPTPGRDDGGDYDFEDGLLEQEE